MSYRPRSPDRRAPIQPPSAASVAASLAPSEPDASPLASAPASPGSSPASGRRPASGNVGPQNRTAGGGSVSQTNPGVTHSSDVAQSCPGASRNGRLGQVVSQALAWGKIDVAQQIWAPVQSALLLQVTAGGVLVSG